MTDWTPEYGEDRHRRASINGHIRWVCDWCYDLGEGDCDKDAPCRCCELAELDAARAAIQRVRDTCGSKQGRQFHNDPWNRGWDAALAWVESALEGDGAQVEDWQDNHALMHKVRLLWTQQAVIQSVRDVCEDYFHDRSDLDAVESLEAIRRALEGDA